jgi:hypothetical protein
MRNCRVQGEYGIANNECRMFQPAPIRTSLFSIRSSVFRRASCTGCRTCLATSHGVTRLLGYGGEIGTSQKVRAAMPF